MAVPLAAAAVCGVAGFAGKFKVFPYFSIIFAALPALGFTTAGIAAGSAAATAQAGIGNVVAGSTFAFLQSAGATGLGSVIGGTIGATAGGIGGAIASGNCLTTRLGLIKTQGPPQLG